jgi:hypothetical protein
VLNLALIADGQDTRTTVMFRNIPNGMSVQDLLTCIASVCPRKIDFLYLRMDFNTGSYQCMKFSGFWAINVLLGRNCGYAFVNFITLQDLLCFAQATLGQKWHSMFPSGRVMHMTYADIQFVAYISLRTLANERSQGKAGVGGTIQKFTCHDSTRVLAT